MRAALVVLSGLVVISGIVSVRLWSDLRAERQLTADLQTQLTEAKMNPHVAMVARSPVAAEPPPVITAAPAPDSRYDSPPARAPQPATSMNQRREDPLPRDEPSQAERVVVDTGFAVNQTGQVRAKPSAIMTSNDLNKDGIVTKEEAANAGKALIRLWNAYDLNKDGVVDDAEITRASGL